MKKALKASLVFLLLAAFGGWILFAAHLVQERRVTRLLEAANADAALQNRKIVQLLRVGDLEAARTALNDYFVWGCVLRRIREAHDPALVQAALDVQFIFWYSAEEDGNFAYREHAGVVAELLSLGAKPTFDQLACATQNESMQIARLLLAKGVPAAMPGAKDCPLVNVAYHGDIAMVMELLDHGADINQANGSGHTPVLEAAWSRQVACLRWLLDHGADVTPRLEDYPGHTAPVWKIVQERAARSTDPDSKAVWELVRAHVPAEPLENGD